MVKKIELEELVVKMGLLLLKMERRVNGRCCCWICFVCEMRGRKMVFMN